MSPAYSTTRKPMTQHASQIASALQRGIQQVLTRGLNDPRVRGMLSVTRVQLSPDLHQATIFVSVLPAEHGALSLHGLRHATAHIRTLVGRSVRIRRMPKFTFRLDESIKKESAVLTAITEARRRDDEMASARRPDASEAPPTPEVSPS